MASALCHHGWPWFKECPFCFQEMWIEGEPPGLMSTSSIIQVHGMLVASSRVLLRSSFVAVIPDVSAPLVGEAEWFELDTTPTFRFTFGVDQRGEARMFGALNPDMERIPGPWLLRTNVAAREYLDKAEVDFRALVFSALEATGAQKSGSAGDLIGKVMRHLKGRGNPAEIHRIIDEWRGDPDWDSYQPASGMAHPSVVKE